MRPKLLDRLARWRGTPIERDLSAYERVVAGIGDLEAGLAPLGDTALSSRSDELIARACAGSALDDLLVEAFALVREAARRTLGLRPYDVQLIAATAMHRGLLAEAQTGEGKTLAAVMPVYLNAATGRGVHVLTFNDYLARRDAAWMGPVYEMLGLTVGAIQEGMGPPERRRQYGCDVTYLTAKEAGFDYLRDGLCTDPESRVHRPFHYAIVDEADSILIDEARIPLVIAGATERFEGVPERLAAWVGDLQGEHYDIEDNARAVNLTDAGLGCAERAFDAEGLAQGENLRLLAQLNCALHAKLLLQRDVDYIVRGGRVEHVDEFTGRVVKDRHWPDGLQTALEAKEGLRLRREGEILGSITLQHFLTMYPGLAGMTATAQPAAEEIERFYGLRVLVVPTHRPCIRADHADMVFTHVEAKSAALVEEIARAHDTERPVLVGTASVRESEQLAAALRREGIECAVLNARTDELEARIVSEAGLPGAVTISTNMAGRGTDIKLGGADERHRDRVVALGGLYVIGTNRHESVRIDNQLRGRAGRQGDPGSSRFFVSLEDPLFVQFGVRDLIPERFRPEHRADPIENPIVRREVERGQRIVEGQNFEIRKTLYNYSSLLEEQRRIVRRRRDEILGGGSPPDLLASGSADLHERLMAAVGIDALERAERQVTLFHIDDCWREHLADIADLREGIHLMRAGRRDPLAHFQQGITDLFLELRDRIETRVIETLQAAPVTADGIDLISAGIKGPSSTWTYLINDDPFRDALANRLSQGGGFAFGAAFMWPLLIAWEMARRWKRKDKRSGPQ